MQANKHNTTFVVRTRNRNKQLLHTLPYLLKWEMPIIICDFRDTGCERAVWVVRQLFMEGKVNSSINIIETVHEYMFLHGHASNLPITHVETEWVMRVDVDYILEDNFFDQQLPDNGQFAYVDSFPNHACLFGLALFEKSAWNGINGYNENIIYPACEDRDFYDRLAKNKVKRTFLNPNTARHEHHNDAIRMESIIQSELPDLLARELKHNYDAFNRKLIDLIPWTRNSKRTAWSIESIGIETCYVQQGNGSIKSYQAIREFQ
jgi:hypothetical protein